MNRSLVFLFVVASAVAVPGDLGAQLLDWAHRAGGPTLDRGAFGVGHDSSGNVYVTGQFQGTATFGQGQPNETSLTESGSGDVFLAKYDNAGDLQWAVQAGGSDQDFGYAIAIAGSDVYVAGRFRFGMTFHDGTFLSGNAAGETSMFLAKYDSNGNFQWARGADPALAWGVAADSGGAFVVGRMKNIADFGSGVTLTSTVVGEFDAFLVRYDSGGNAQWAQQGRGSNPGVSTAVAADSGGAFVIGDFVDTIAFDLGGPNETTLSGSQQFSVFVSRFDAAGNLAWAKAIGGDGQIQGTGIAVDRDGNSYVTGYISGEAVFGSGEPGQTTLTSLSGTDAFIASLDASGSLV